jgi:hypothetical protein
MASVLPLRRGTNVVVAVSGRSEAPLETKLNLLAAHVGALLGGVPEWAGTLPSGTSVWNIGQGRPVFLRRLQNNRRLDDWYAAMGEPVGPDREYWSVVIDWRGADVDASVPAGSFVIPAATRAIHGAESWPDGTIAEQRERVATIRSDDALARAADSMRGTYRHISSTMPSLAPIAAAGVAAVAAWLWLRAR